MGLLQLIVTMLFRERVMSEDSADEIEEIQEEEEIEEEECAEPFIPQNARIKSMKISEKQLLMLIEIANAASKVACDEGNDMGIYSYDEIDELLKSIRDNMSIELVEVAALTPADATPNGVGSTS